MFSLRREQMLNRQTSLRRLLKVVWDRLCLEPRTHGTEQMIVGGTLASARAFAVAAREIFGGEPTPGAGLIQHREGALLARGEDVVLAEAQALVGERAKLHRHALSPRALARPAPPGDDAVLSREFRLKAVGHPMLPRHGRTLSPIW